MDENLFFQVHTKFKPGCGVPINTYSSNRKVIFLKSKTKSSSQPVHNGNCSPTKKREKIIMSAIVIIVKEAV